MELRETIQRVSKFGGFAECIATTPVDEFSVLITDQLGPDVTEGLEGVAVKLCSTCHRSIKQLSGGFHQHCGQLRKSKMFPREYLPTSDIFRSAIGRSGLFCQAVIAEAIQGLVAPPVVLDPYRIG